MGYKRKPVYHFNAFTDTGIDKIPTDRVIICDSRIFVKGDGSSLTETSTLQDAIDATAVHEIQSSNYSEGIIFVDADTQLAPANIYVCDTEGEMLGEDEVNYTLTMPLNPRDKDKIIVMDGSSNAQDRPILLKYNGNNIDGLADDVTLDVNYFDVTIIYNATDDNWSIGG